MKIPFEVIYEDNHLLVINKPAGMLVQGDKTGDESLLEIGKQYIKEKYQKPGNVFLGSAHRLDRPVSGVLVFARTSKALSRMQELFREKQVQKTYYAVVKPAPDYEFQELKHWIAKDKTKNISRAYDKDGKNRKESMLSYRLLGRQGKLGLLEVNPTTGRPHQIRVQLSAVGCPILGDLKYHAQQTNPDGNIALHAHKIEFLHPVGKAKVWFQAALPKKDPWVLFEELIVGKFKSRHN